MDTAPLLGEYYRLVVDGRVRQLLALLRAAKDWRGIAEERLHGEMADLRQRLGELPTEIREEFGDDFSMLDTTQRDLYASLAVHVASAVESIFDSICRRRSLSLPVKANWGQKRQAVENHLQLNCDDLPGMKEATLARVLGNCFKHSGGLLSDEAVKVGCGTKGDVIRYEDYDWRSIIGRVGDFLNDLTSRL
jgi:hypothetical protein